MTMSLPLPAPRRVGPRMGIRVDPRLNPRVDARARMNLRNCDSQARQSHRRPVVPELAITSKAKIINWCPVHAGAIRRLPAASQTTSA